jgi:hypothetical protein
METRPSEPVTTISVRIPLAKFPVGPSSGRRTETDAPSTGRPASSLNTITMGCDDRVPAVWIDPSPSCTRIRKMAGAESV